MDRLHHRGDWGIEVANVRPVELSVSCTLLRLLQFKHLRINGLKVKFDNHHSKKRFFHWDLDSSSNADTDLAKGIIMSAVGRFIICKVDRIMFWKGRIGKIRKGQPILKIKSTTRYFWSIDRDAYISNKKNNGMRCEGEELWKVPCAF